ncbi:MAG: phage tail tube protein [Oscillospiraceae bacterium]|nr:phage tail tube protein [Oscillospiraceae bacterium]
MNNYTPKRVINGTFGEMWLDSEYCAEVTGLQAKISIEKQDVNQCGAFFKGSKVTGASGSGTIKANKVTSFFSKLVLDCIRTRKFPEYTIISNLADPDAYGAERVKLTGVTLDEATIADWEANKLGEQSIPFTFNNAEFLDFIDV